MPGKLRAPKDVAWAASRPLDQAWIEKNLLLLGTQCEWRACAAQAVWAYEGVRAIAYLCAGHRDLVQSKPKLGATVEAWLWELFDLSYNFIYQNNVTGGSLLACFEARDEAITALEKAAAVAARKQLVSAVADIKAAHRTLVAQVKPGTPDGHGAKVAPLQLPSLQISPAGIMAIDLIPVALPQQEIDDIERGQPLPVLMVGLIT